MEEKLEVMVEWEDENDIRFAEKLRFTGQEVDSYNVGDVTYTLYECPGGYRVHEEDGGSGHAYLAPYEPSAEEPYHRLFTAEEVGGGAYIRLAGPVATVQQGLRAPAGNVGGHDLRRDESAHAAPTGASGVKIFGRANALDSLFAKLPLEAVMNLLRSGLLMWKTGDRQGIELTE